MKTSVNYDMFKDDFRRYDRLENFALPGALPALFDYLEDLENDTGSEIELDVVALCCDFAEFSSAKEAAAEYGEHCETEEEALEYLRDNTAVIEFDGGVIVQGF